MTAPHVIEIREADITIERYVTIPETTLRAAQESVLRYRALERYALTEYSPEEAAKRRLAAATLAMIALESLLRQVEL